MYCLSSLETRCHAEAHTCDNSDCPETGLAVQKEELPVDSGRTVPSYQATRTQQYVVVVPTTKY